PAAPAPGGSWGGRGASRGGRLRRRGGEASSWHWAGFVAATGGAGSWRGFVPATGGGGPSGASRGGSPTPRPGGGTAAPPPPPAGGCLDGETRAGVARPGLEAPTPIRPRSSVTMWNSGLGDPSHRSRGGFEGEDAEELVTVGRGEAPPPPRRRRSRLRRRRP